MTQSDNDTPGGGSKAMQLGTWACCAVMLVPVLVFFAGGGTVSALTGNLGVLAPILICVAAHGAMALFMGKSCHGDRKVAERKANPETPAISRPTRDF